jgi:hypothetical protein
MQRVSLHQQPVEINAIQQQGQRCDLAGQKPYLTSASAANFASHFALEGQSPSWMEIPICTLRSRLGSLK